MKPTVLVVGGGLAGLSTAVYAFQAGYIPVILERTANLGGRARSLFAKDLNQEIDNGQHVLAASYHSTHEFMGLIESPSKIHFQPQLSLSFTFNSKRQFDFRSWKIPAPLHFLMPLITRIPLTGNDFRHLFKFGISLNKTDPEKLRDLTVQEWLQQSGDAPFLTALLWEPITLATLNTPIHSASAYLLYQVLTQAFLGDAKKSGLGLPQTGLSEIFAKPARDFIVKNGGEIYRNVLVKEIHLANGKIEQVIAQNEKTFQEDFIVMAVPPKALGQIKINDENLAEKLNIPVEKLGESPIITIYLWLEISLPGTFPKSLINSPLQWLFQLPIADDSPHKNGYSIVISADSDVVNKSKSEILEMTERELTRIFGFNPFADQQLIKSKIIKEKSATFLQTPAALKHRPSAKTTIKNLFLAGDWVDTGLPATIESAILSGKMAVAEMNKKR